MSPTYVVYTSIHGYAFGESYLDGLWALTGECGTFDNKTEPLSKDEVEKILRESIKDGVSTGSVDEETAAELLAELPAELDALHAEHCRLFAEVKAIA